MSEAALMAHVYAVDQGLNLQDETVQFMSYDDAATLLIVIKGSIVFGYSVREQDSQVDPHDRLAFTVPLQDGPPVLAARCSPDRGLLALQRSPCLLELVDLGSGNIAVQGSDKGRHEILSFFFTDNPDAAMVLVTRGGLELSAFVANRRGLRLKDTIRLPVSWCLYTHETRMLLVATTSLAGSYLQAWQFLGSGLVTLPPFVLAGGVVGPGGSGGIMTGPPVAVAAGRGGLSGVSLPSSAYHPHPGYGAIGPVLPGMVSSDQVRLVKMYGRVYCAHLNTCASKLELYRFYTDTVILQHSYELFSPYVDLSVVDNTLVLHYLDSGVAVLVDVMADTLQPVANPLPLAVLVPDLSHWDTRPSPRKRLMAASSNSNLSAPPSTSASVTSLLNAAASAAGAGSGFGAGASGTAAAGTDDLEGGSGLEGLASSVALLSMGQEGAPSTSAHTPPGTPGGPQHAQVMVMEQHLASAAHLGHHQKAIVRSSSSLLMNRWRFLAPNMALDPRQQVLYRLQLDLRAVAESCGEPAMLAGFLQRRRCPPGCEPRSQPRALLLALVKSTLQERLPMPVLRHMYDDINRAYVDLVVSVEGAGGVLAAAHSTGHGPAAAPNGAAVPQVLSPMEVTEQVFRWLHRERIVDTVYLLAAVNEYCCSACLLRAPLPACLQQLQLGLMTELGQADQVAMVVACQGHQMAAEVVAGSLEGVADLLPRASQLEAVLHSQHLASGIKHRSLQPSALAVAGDNTGQTAEEVVRLLLQKGQVLRAVRVAKAMHVKTVLPKEFLSAAAATGDVGLAAAVYRCFKDALMPAYPKFDVARAQLMGLSLPTSVAAATP